MRTSAAGSEALRGCSLGRRQRAGGFTLIELLVVLAIVALASAGVAFALRDRSDTLLDREAQRLASLLDAARAQSRASGQAVRWVPADTGFRFEGLPGSTLPTRWLDASTRAAPAQPLLLGPEPLIAPQAVTLQSDAAPGRALQVATDGLGPFIAQPLPRAQP